MKKLFSLLIVVCLICLSGCTMNVNEIALESKYEVDGVSDYKISSYSGLGLKLLKYTEEDVEKQVYLLAYLADENIEINTDNVYIKSLAVGKTCISLTSTIMDVGRRINEDILIDLVGQLNDRLSEGSAEKLVENMGEGKFYIISKNSEYVFIDYITTIPNIYDKIVYYRIILQDISMLDTEITNEEKEALPNYLSELLEELGITEEIELPKK